MSPVDRQNIVRKLHEALACQRDRLGRYLQQLERQERAIRDEDLAAIREHVAVEQEALAEMHALQRVIDPLEGLYAAAHPRRESSVPALRRSLSAVREKVLARNEINHQLLQERLSTVREEIHELRARSSQTSPFTDIGAPSLLDVRA